MSNVNVNGKNVTMWSFSQTAFEELCGHEDVGARVFWALWSENAPGEMSRLANVRTRLWDAQDKEA
jgi:hypothetical protein